MQHGFLWVIDLFGFSLREEREGSCCDDGGARRVGLFNRF